jgi:hypothetical protein
MGQIADFIQLKNGQYVNGVVEVKVFTIKTPYGTLKLPKKEILVITYKNPPHFLSDEAKISAGTRLEGDISPSTISIRVEGGSQTLRIPKSDIHSLVFFMSNKRSISSATRRRLSTLK